MARAIVFLLGYKAEFDDEEPLFKEGGKLI